MLKLPTHVQIEISDICNLRCKHCYHFDTEKMPESLDLGEDEIIQLVQKLVEAKIYSLVITGGEPLVRPNTTMKVVKIAKEAGIFVSINTNLLLITREIIYELKNQGLDSFLVSCPASDAGLYREITRCGNYSRLVSNIKLVVDAGIPCMVNMVVTPANINFVKSTATDLYNLGINRFAATPASLNVENPNYSELLDRNQVNHLLEDLRWCIEALGLDVDILEPLPKCFFPSWCWEKDYAFTKRVCQAGRMSVSISNTGDVRPCSHNPIVYGNLFKENLEDIWSKMDYYRTSAIPGICLKCPSVSLCNGACRTNSLASTGFLDQPDRLLVGPVSLPGKRQIEARIKESSLVSFNGILRWRQEGDNYSISSKKGGGNLMVVNEELFLFTQWLSNSSPISFEKINKDLESDSEKRACMEILEILVKKEFLSIT